jgi:hypothetical protein
VESDDDPTPLTPERIQTEASLDLSNPVSITVDSTPAIQFDLPHDNPPTHQAWFLHDGFLYQVEAYTSDTQSFDHLLASWHFSS